MRRLIAITASALLLSFPSTADDEQVVLERYEGFSDRCRMLVVDPELGASLPPPSPAQLQAWSSLVRWQDSIRSTQFRRGLVSVADGGIELAASFDPLGRDKVLDAINLPARMFGSETWLGVLNEHMDEARVRSLRDTLTALLNEDQRNQAVAEDWTLETLESRFLLGDELTRLMDERVGDLTVEERQEFQDAITKQLRRDQKTQAAALFGLRSDVQSLRRAFEDLTAIVAYQDDLERVRASVQNLEASTTAINESLSRIGDRVDTNEQRIGANAARIRLLERQNRDTSALVTENRALIDETRNDLAFLKDFAWSRMSPTEKLTALDKGLYGTEDPDKRRALVEHLKVQRNLRWAATGLGEAAAALPQLGKLLGVEADPGTIRALQVGAGLSSAADKAMSGDYAGAIMSALGLFGSHSDPAAQRHKDVMKALVRIDAKLDRLLKNQQLIYDQLIAVRKQLARIEEKINAIDQKQELVLQAVTEQAELKTIACEAVQDALTLAHDFDARSDKQAEYFATLRDLDTDFASCAHPTDGLDSLLRFRTGGKDPRVHHYLTAAMESAPLGYLGVQAEARTNAIDFENVVYAERLDYFLHSYRSDVAVGIHRALLQPQSTWSMPLPVKDSSRLEYQWMVERPEILSRLLSPTRVQRIAEIVNATHHLHGLFDKKNGEFLTPNQWRNPSIRSVRTRPSRGLRWTRSASDIVALAQVQQAILHGSPIIPQLAHGLQQPRSSDAYADAHRILSREAASELLRANFAMYWVTDGLTSMSANGRRRLTWRDYDWATSFGRPSDLERILGRTEATYECKAESEMDESVHFTESTGQTTTQILLGHRCSVTFPPPTSDGTALRLDLPPGFKVRSAEYVHDRSSVGLIQEHYRLVDQTLGYHESTGPLSPSATDEEAAAYLQLVGLVNETRLPELMRETVLFAYGKDQIAGPDQLAPINRVWNTYAGKPDVVIRIVGFADNRGSSEANCDLSLRRATAVRQLLLDRGVPQARIQVAGLGEVKRPSFSPPGALGLDRRADIHVIEDLSGSSVPPMVSPCSP